jgi:hypothetical protein
MGVTTDEHAPIRLGPSTESLFDTASHLRVLCWPCWIRNAQKLCMPPEVSSGKPTDTPEAVINRAALMTVSEEHLLASVAMLQNEPFMHKQAQEERPARLSAIVPVVVELCFNDIRVLADDIVIAPDHSQTARIRVMKPLHLPEDVVVLASNLIKIPILPELIAVSEFNICVSLGKVVIEGMEKEQLIVSEVVCPAIVATVTVTEDDEA